MSTVAFLTLGCKVNQYDTQAMLEGFLAKGYQVKDFDQICDVYVVNTCTVTGTGDQKSLKAIRQAARRNPDAAIIAAGCLSQRDGAALSAMAGVRLVLGTQSRAMAAQLVEDAISRNVVINAVKGLNNADFEENKVTAHEGHTRAVLKIQEGCENRCSYCIIPDVRGPVRSRELPAVAKEAARLGASGFQEIVLTGIHICSYGRDLDNTNLIDAILAVCQAQGVQRVRLGSLEPSWVTPEIAQTLGRLPQLCRHFHLSLQSGCDGILKRMRRRYTTAGFTQAVASLREAMPGCAITTDVITGFPGEGDAEFEESYDFCRKINFSRIHVFPYSERIGTDAAGYDQAVPMALRRDRASRLIALAQEMEAAYVRSQVGQVRHVLFEEDGDGLTGEYVRVNASQGVAGEICPVRITDANGTLALGQIIKEEK